MGRVPSTRQLDPPTTPLFFPAKSSPKSFNFHPNWFDNKMHLIISCKNNWQWCNMQFSLFTLPLQFLPLICTGTETVVKLNTCGSTWHLLSGLINVHPQLHWRWAPVCPVKHAQGQHWPRAHSHIWDLLCDSDCDYHKLLEFVVHPLLRLRLRFLFTQ